MDRATAWSEILHAAADLGILPEARKKWRMRGVPHRWRIPLLERFALKGVDFNPVFFSGLRSIHSSDDTESDSEKRSSHVGAA